MQQADVPRTSQQVENEMGLLDLLVTVTENIKLLLIAPMTAGLVAYGASYFLPQSFDSIAIVKADQQIATLATTTSVLDAVAARIRSAQGMATEASTDLQSRVKASLNAKDRQVTLTVSDRTPKMAQATATALLKELQARSVPNDLERVRLNAVIADSKQRIVMAERALNKLSAQVEAIVDPTGFALRYADLLATIAGAQSEIHAIEAQLLGLTEAQIAQAPTLPSVAGKPDKKAITTIAALAVGFISLLFVFIRESLRRASANPATAAKLLRIRRALGMVSRAEF